MLDENLLNQYHEILGNEGLHEIYTNFSQHIDGYFTELQQCVQAHNEQATRDQAHKIKGACRSIGLRKLAEQMGHIEKEAWHWNEVDALLAQWQTELPLHQHELRHWLHARRI